MGIDIGLEGMLTFLVELSPWLTEDLNGYLSWH